MAGTTGKAKGKGKSVQGKNLLSSFPEGNVRVGLGATINMGDYNSARIDVSIQLPFDASSKHAMEETYKEAITWTKAKLKEETTKLRSGSES